MTPTTKAGRALLRPHVWDMLHSHPGKCLSGSRRESVLAIEREAAAAERERLRVTLESFQPVKPGWVYWKQEFLAILAEPTE